MKDFNEYSLFTDVEDKELQARNRAVTMYNIFEDNSMGKNKVSIHGTQLLLGYLNAVPEAERAPIIEKFHLMAEGAGNV